MIFMVLAVTGTVAEENEGQCKRNYPKRFELSASHVSSPFDLSFRSD
jgi:hypothetical protein